MFAVCSFGPEFEQIPRIQNTEYRIWLRNRANSQITEYRFQSHRADESRDLRGVNEAESRVQSRRMSSAGDDLIAESQIPMIQSVTSGHATQLMSAESRFLPRKDSRVND